MENKPSLQSGRIFYASPWIFAAACALLAFIIAVFAVNNYQREKKLMGLALSQEGQAVLSLVSSGSRAAVRGTLMGGQFDTAAWLKAVQQVIENSSEHPGIVSLFLVDKSGRVLAHNSQERLGTQTDQQTVAFMKRIRKDNPRENNRVRQQADGNREVFQIATTFNPLMFGGKMPSHFREMFRSRMGRMMGERGVPAEDEQYLETIAGQKYYLIAELDMADFQQSVRKQFLQIVILSIVLLLVGIGGLLSLMTLQGLRGSQKRLRRMSAFTDVLVSSLPVGLIATGADGRIRTCNKSACDMIGLQEGMIRGEEPYNVLPGPFLEIFQGRDLKRSQPPGEITVTNESGTEKSLHVSQVRIEDSEQQHAGEMLLIQDFSELKKLEIELQRSERHAALGKMAAGVAHELRNPLSSIKGLALLLKSKFRDDTSGRETVDVLVSEVERLNRSIGELLDYGRPDLLKRIEVNVDEIVRKAVMLILSDAETAQVVVTADYQAAQCPVRVDRDKLTQVLLNLFINSLQAMPDGGELRVATRIEDDSLQIEISDTGQGIEAPFLATVFDPYFTTKNDGTGLGLSLSGKIIEDHHGTITLASEIGTGTTVTIRLPIH